MHTVPTGVSAAGSSNPTASLPWPPGSSAPGPRVAIIDDNHALRATINELLTDAGIEVVAEAADGMQALRAIPPAAYQLPLVVLMDLRMPGPINGIETTRLLIDRCDQVAVIIFTAFPGAGIEQAARQAGAVELLVKGCPAEAIVAAVRQAWVGMVPVGA
jgi:DNA-binding NarL/FixJ family response regulator